MTDLTTRLAELKADMDEVRDTWGTDDHLLTGSQSEIAGLRSHVLALIAALEGVRELIGRLAPETPMSQDEMGGCVWCGGPDINYAHATADPKDHEKDCPWVEARALLDGEATS